MKEYHFYIDDSGTRNPDRKPNLSTFGGDWFALGGVIIAADDEAKARDLHASFCDRWRISDPLHSIKIRHRKGPFAWLAVADAEEVTKFFSELDQLVAEMPVYALACVIDRPGYNRRYSEKFGASKWSLCKTAFSIIAERSAKFALANDARLRLFVERSDKDSEGLIKAHYRELREVGMPFAPGTSEKYRPLAAEEMKRRLYDLKIKSKSSPIIQMADLLLYPLCKAGYDPEYRPKTLLRERGRLLESVIEPSLRESVGTKYSCFDLNPLGTAT